MVFVDRSQPRPQNAPLLGVDVALDSDLEHLACDQVGDRPFDRLRRLAELRLFGPQPAAALDAYKLALDKVTSARAYRNAYVDLARARDLYQMLATTEPQNTMHMQNYQQVVGRMEGESPATGITAEEGAVIIEELESTAPVVDQGYPDHIAIAVRSAVTDADLFLSYNLPDKAVVPLLGALPQAPRRCDGLRGRCR